jgi:hypothetical protein
MHTWFVAKDFAHLVWTQSQDFGGLIDCIDGFIMEGPVPTERVHPRLKRDLGPCSAVALQGRLVDPGVRGKSSLSAPPTCSRSSGFMRTIKENVSIHPDVEFAADRILDQRLIIKTARVNRAVAEQQFQSLGTERRVLRQGSIYRIGVDTVHDSTAA